MMLRTMHIRRSMSILLYFYLFITSMPNTFCLHSIVLERNLLFASLHFSIPYIAS